MLRVTTVFTGIQGAPYYNNLYFGGETAGEAQAALNAAAGFWNDLNGLQVSALQWASQADVFVIDPDTGLATGSFVVTPDDGAGSDSGAALPFATQGLMRWRTGVFVAGRELRGRTFLPGCAQADSTGGKPSGAFQSTANISAANLLTAAGAAGDLVVYSRTHKQAALVTTGSCWSEYAVLRSRRD